MTQPSGTLGCIESTCSWAGFASFRFALRDHRLRHAPVWLFLVAAAIYGAIAAQAGPVPTRASAVDQEPMPDVRVAMPPQVRVLSNQSYGADPLERYDVYLPESAPGAGVPEAPVLFMVHGGAWAFGDKTNPSVVENKIARWVTRGVIVVSVNFPVKRRIKAIEQARAVAHALAHAQGQAARWGADRRRFVLMGHSAGAHLVSLIATEPEVTAGLKVTPWLGTVALDNAAFDVLQIMRSPRYPRFYDRAFGNELAYWRRASPLYALKQAGAPLMAVCSSRRADACPQAQAFVDKAVPMGMRVVMLEEDLAHGDINRELGRDSGYTEAVESFIASLDPGLAPWFGVRAVSAR